MAVANPPTWLSGNETEYAPEADRRLIGALLAPNGRESMLARPGTKPGTMQFSAPGNGLYVDVAPGSCVIQSEDRTGGVYVCQNPSPTRVQAPAADGSLPRRDIVVARVYDQPGRREWALEVIAGAPAAAPQNPATPPNCTVLCWYQLPAGATRVTQSMLNDVHTEYAALGGFVPIAPGRPLPGDPYSGMPAYRMASKDAVMWDGGAWRVMAFVPQRPVSRVDRIDLGDEVLLRANQSRRLLERSFTLTEPSIVTVKARCMVEAGSTVAAAARAYVYINGADSGWTRIHSKSTRLTQVFQVEVHGEAYLGPGRYPYRVDMHMDDADARGAIIFSSWSGDVFAKPVT